MKKRIFLICISWAMTIFCQGQQQYSVFNIRLILNTEDGAGIPNINLTAEPPATLSGRHLHDGIYELSVDRPVGTTIKLILNPDIFAVVNRSDMRVTIQRKDQEPETYILCRKEEFLKWKNKETMVEYSKSSITSSLNSFKLGNQKSMAQDPASDPLFKELILSSRLKIFLGKPDNVLKEANESFIHGDINKAKKQLLRSNPFDNLQKSELEKSKLDSSIENSNQEILLLGDVYLKEANLDSALLCYILFVKNDSSDLVTLSKIISLQQLKSDKNQALYWISRASKIIPANGNDSARLALLRFEKKQALSTITEKDIDSLYMEMSNTSISDEALQSDIALEIGLDYLALNNESKANSILRPVYESSKTEYTYGAYYLLYQWYLSRGNFKKADSLNQVFIVQATAQLAIENSQSTKLFLLKALFDQETIQSTADKMDTAKINKYLTEILDEFERQPTLFAEAIFFLAIVEYDDAILQDADDENNRYIETFYKQLIRRIEKLNSRFDNSLCLSYLYFDLSNYYTENEKKRDFIKAYLSSVRYATKKAAKSAPYTYYLGSLLTEPDFIDEYVKDQDFIRNLKAVLQYYWHYQDHHDYLIPIVLGCYLTSDFENDEHPDLDLFLTTFGIYHQNLQNHMDDDLYWKYYTDFADDSFWDLYDEKKPYLLQEILANSHKLLKIRAEKYATKSSYAEDFARIAINNEMLFHFKVKGNKEAELFIDTTLEHYCQLYLSDTLYQNILLSIATISIPRFAETCGQTDSTLKFRLSVKYSKIKSLFKDTSIIIKLERQELQLSKEFHEHSLETLKYNFR